MTEINDRTGWICAATATAISLAGYLFTLAPSITLEHSGSLIVAGDYLGVGRVPGYPLWHLLAYIFTRLFGFVSYHGHPNPAWALNFMSASFGSLSCGLVAWMVVRLSAGSGLSGERPSRIVRAVPAVSAALVFAFGRVTWSQAVIAETHTLTCFCVLSMLALLIRWMDAPSLSMAMPLSFILGVSLSQSQILVLMLPAFLLALLFKHRGLFLDVIIFIILGTALVMLTLSSGSNPYVLVAAVCSALLLVLLPLRYLPFGRLVLGMTGAAILGLSLHLYLPLASEGNPPMNWGYAQTWQGFLYVISRGQYERMMPINVFTYPHAIVCLTVLYGRMLTIEFTLPIVLPALFSMGAVLPLRGTAAKGWGMLILSFVMYSLILLIGAAPQCDVQTLLMLRRYLIPSFALFAVHLGLGLAFVLQQGLVIKTKSAETETAVVTRL